MPALVTPELYDPLYHTPQDDLYEIYQVLRDEHPVYHCERRDVWCISRFEDAQAAARDWETFSSANGVDLDLPPQFFGIGNFLEQDPPNHDALRKVVRPFFIPKEIARLEQQVTERVQALAEPLADGGRVDLAQEFAWALPIWVICRLLGAPASDNELIHSFVRTLETRHAGEEDPTQRMLPTLRSFHAYIEEFAEQKRKAPSSDLMSHLVAAEAQGALRREEIFGLTVLLFAAGSETTASLIGNTLQLLDQNPDAQEALRARPEELIDAAIEESLRVEAPVQYLARRTTKPVLMHGVEIPQEADVILLFGAANHDERHFERAATFDLDRPQQRHLAFGEGIHFCVGAPLARLEARLAIPAFLRSVASYEIVRPTKRFIHHNVRGYVHLPAMLG
jgi:cytochrome P450